MEPFGFRTMHEFGESPAFRVVMAEAAGTVRLKTWQLAGLMAVGAGLGGIGVATALIWLRLAFG